ncbi:hypothetical protein PR048_029722 [Dryococelus australis]|uniref:Uncharacterized protein n=1 Tax=Dryococelus australis TaxID=614101 RepID=A0ABQ9GE68_9NEOP|nr:hypothetical protein PR048_029722 [Dryococelus australis]
MKIIVLWGLAVKLCIVCIVPKLSAIDVIRDLQFVQVVPQPKLPVIVSVQLCIIAVMVLQGWSIILVLIHITVEVFLIQLVLRRVGRKSLTVYGRRAACDHFAQVVGRGWNRVSVGLSSVVGPSTQVEVADGVGVGTGYVTGDSPFMRSLVTGQVRVYPGECTRAAHLWVRGRRDDSDTVPYIHRRPHIILSLRRGVRGGFLANVVDLHVILGDGGFVDDFPVVVRTSMLGDGLRGGLQIYLTPRVICWYTLLLGLGLGLALRVLGKVDVHLAVGPLLGRVLRPYGGPFLVQDDAAVAGGRQVVVSGLQFGLLGRPRRAQVVLLCCSRGDHQCCQHHLPTQHTHSLPCCTSAANRTCHHNTFNTLLYQATSTATELTRWLVTPGYVLVSDWLLHVGWCATRLSADWRTVPWQVSLASYSILLASVWLELRARAVVCQQLDYWSHTKASQVQSPVGPLLDFRKWESCRNMPLLGGFSPRSLVSPAFALRCCFILTSSHHHRLSRPRFYELPKTVNCADWLSIGVAVPVMCEFLLSDYCVRLWKRLVGCCILCGGRGWPASHQTLIGEQLPDILQASVRPQLAVEADTSPLAGDTGDSRENPLTPSGIYPGLPGWEASILTTTPPVLTCSPRSIICSGFSSVKSMSGMRLCALFHSVTWSNPDGQHKAHASVATSEAIMCMTEDMLQIKHTYGRHCSHRWPITSMTEEDCLWHAEGLREFHHHRRHLDYILTTSRLPSHLGTFAISSHSLHWYPLIDLVGAHYSRHVRALLVEVGQHLQSNTYCAIFRARVELLARQRKANPLHLLARTIIQGDMHRGKEGLRSPGLHFGDMTTSLSALRAGLNYEEQEDLIQFQSVLVKKPCQKVRRKLERASKKQSNDTSKTPYDRVKGCRERKINIKGCRERKINIKGCRKRKINIKGCRERKINIKGCRKRKINIKGCRKRKINIKGCRERKTNGRVPNTAKSNFFQNASASMHFHEWIEWLDYSPPTKANRVLFPAGSPPGGCRIGRLRWSEGFPGDLLLPLPLHSGAAPYAHHFTLVGSKHLDVNSRSNFPSPLTSLGCLQSNTTIPSHKGKPTITKGKLYLRTAPSIIAMVGRDARLSELANSEVCCVNQSSDIHVTVCRGLPSQLRSSGQWLEIDRTWLSREFRLQGCHSPTYVTMGSAAVEDSMQHSQEAVVSGWTLTGLGYHASVVCKDVTGLHMSLWALQQWRAACSTLRKQWHDHTADALSRICSALDNTDAKLKILHEILCHPGVTRLNHWVKRTSTLCE